MRKFLKALGAPFVLLKNIGELHGFCIYTSPHMVRTNRHGFLGRLPPDNTLYEPRYACTGEVFCQ